MGRGERDWRVDREHFGRGRRGGRGSGPNPCFHFARGRCHRGNLCRYLHISRETMVQDRGPWRRDIQPERHNLDAIREDYTGDKHNRGQWRRDPWPERHEDFGARPQEFTVEKQEREVVLSSRMLLEDAGGDPSSNRVAMPPSKGEFWTSRNSLEAKDIQDMAYNKALELVGIPHMPRESMVAEELVIGNNKAQVDEKKFECNKVSEQNAMVEVSSVLTLDTPKDVDLLKLPEGREEISLVESPGYIGGDLFHKKSVMETNDKVEESEFSKLDASNEDTEISQKLDIKEQESSRDVQMAEDAGVVGEVAGVIGEVDARDVVLNSTGEADLPEKQDEKSDTSRITEVSEDLVDGLSNSLAIEPTGRSQEPENRESRSEICVTESEARGNDFLVPETVGRLNASAELEPLREVDVDPDLEGKVPKDVSNAEVIKKPEATGLSEVTANSPEVGSQASLEAKALGKTNVQSAKNMTKDGFKKSDSSTGVSVPLEGEPHVPATEVLVQRADSAPQLLPPTPQGQQQVLIGEPAPGIPILPPPSQGQQHIYTGQPVSAPPLLLAPSQGQAHLSIDQSNAHIYPPGSMQHPAFTGNLPRPTQYSSFRTPPNLLATTSQPLDQASRPRAKYNSGSTAYLPAGGWGQQSFQPRASTQEVAPGNQLHGPPNYGTSIRQSHGPSTSGAPFYGPPNHGDKFSQHHYSGDQPQHHRPPNPGDQYPQHYRPPNSGGFGHTNPGGYGPTNPAGVGPTNPGSTNSGGFGPPNTGGPFSQHHGSSNPGAPFSQHHVSPSPTGPFPQHPPPQNYRPPNHGSPFLPQSVPQNYGQPNQPTYGASFPAQHGNQNPVSTQQPGNASQFFNSSVIPQQQLAPTQQGFSSNASFMPEQSQSVPSFAGATGNQVMQPNVVNVGFSPNPAFSSAQGNTPWNFQAPQRPALPPTGQSLSYSYPLTTIPPLSGLVPVSQVTNLPLQKDQYDPLSDISASGLDGASKMTLVRPLLDGQVSAGTGTTALAAHIGNDSQEPNPNKANVLVSRPETVEADTKNANEDVGMVENMSPENWSPGPAAEETETGQEQALSKKSSRGLKMLRSAIADHVKEVLKPTWREGYMSKEAFKTIAKKAVEKVVGNLPSHHIPKSQEKVDQFMKASRSKISKLVQVGYSDFSFKVICTGIPDSNLFYIFSHV